jgi:hypothetical protein
MLGQVRGKYRNLPKIYKKTYKLQDFDSRKGILSMAGVAILTRQFSDVDAG